MTDHLNITGRLIAQARMDRESWDYQPGHDLFVFHDPAAGWTLLTLQRAERYDDNDVIASAEAQVYTSSYGSVAALAEAISGRYYTSGWHRVLANIDFNQGIDPGLYLLWATWRMESDFQSLSIHVKDLALASTFFATESDLLPAAGRELDGWEAHHLNLMAAQLTDAGYEILDQAPDVELKDHPARDPLLGVLQLRRYGHDATAVVRVDDVGEVFIRLHYPPGDGPALSPFEDPDDD